MIRVLPAVLLAACAASNDALLRALEERAVEAPRPELHATLHGRDAAPPLTPLRALTLPLKEGPVPLVNGVVNGVPVTVLLDTGTSHVGLTGRLARDTAVYLPPGEAVPVITPGRATPHRLAVIETIRLGPLAFGPAQAFVPVREPRRRDHVVVGGSVLSHFRVTFDFRRDEARLVPHGRPGTADSLFIEAALDGRPYVLLVDSGAASLVLEPWAADELGVRRRLDRLAVAGRTFRDVETRVIGTFKGVDDGAGRRPAGLLGLKGLGAFVWTLDYGTSRLTVED